MVHFLRQVFVDKSNSESISTSLFGLKLSKV